MPAKNRKLTKLYETGKTDHIARQGSLFDIQEKPRKPSRSDSWQGISDLKSLRGQVTQCCDCELRQGAKGVVFGDGNPTARILMVGEGPGQNEDNTGKPFVGRAGQLLDSIFHSVGLSRDDVFITNIVKCRPPGNRMPTPLEVNACLPHLKAQIRIIRPQIIVLLGALASQTLIDPSIRVTRDRGKWFEKDGFSYLVTFHPAAVLRDEANKKKLVIGDFQSLKSRCTDN